MTSDPDSNQIGFLLRGVWPEDRVRVITVPSTRAIVPAVEAAIDAAWIETSKRPGVQLFDGPVCRLERLAVEADGSLRVDVSKTSYRINVGTNFTNPQLADEFGPDVMANPLGVSAGLVSADNYLVYGRRNASVAYYPHRLHPFAGSLEVRDAINLFDDCRRELHEEIGLPTTAIASIELIGIVEDRKLRHPESIFRVRSTLTLDEIQAKVDPVEHAASEGWHCDAETLTKMLRRADVTPVGRAIARRLIELLAA